MCLGGLIISDSRQTGHLSSDQSFEFQNSRLTPKLNNNLECQAEQLCTIETMSPLVWYLGFIYSGKVCADRGDSFNASEHYVSWKM